MTTPEQVLAIAASQWTEIPTPRQIMKALEAGGFRIVSSDAGAMPANIDPIGIIKEIIERRGISANRLANFCELSPSTLNRALNNPDHKFMISTRTLKKITDWDRLQGDKPAISLVK